MLIAIRLNNFLIKHRLFSKLSNKRANYTTSNTKPLSFSLKRLEQSGYLFDSQMDYTSAVKTIKVLAASIFRKNTLLFILLNRQLKIKGALLA